MTSTEIANVGIVTNTNIDISRGYSSITGTDVETRKRVYTAVANSEKIADNLNVPFFLVDILTQLVQTEETDPKTGVTEEVEYLRTTLLTADGKAFSAGSKGIQNSVDTLIRAMGEPSTWEPGGYEVKVVEKKAAKGKFFSIEFV